ncbi:hypothetical protein [Cohnella lupini]|uniref:Uncharacterized protein n=1 Tax=Cohnella lupini TaxID=1294267 RepID=A0A3D9I7B9_9BACL|nr:hypothetical protein [Cohnella lupini]RED57642.1 hypothetical protein DFP95_110115 [Cohnella lupini]
MEQVNFDEEVLKKRITERILRKMERQPQGVQSKLPPTDLKPLIDAHNILNVDFYSHRKGFGRLIVLIKKLLRKLLAPILMKQIHFNQRSIDYLSSVDQRLEALRQNGLGYKVEQQERLDSIANDISDVIIEELRLVKDQLESDVLSITKLNESRYNDVKVSLLRELADIEHLSGNEQRKYLLLLMALRSKPDDLELEQKVIDSFERLNKVGLIRDDDRI